MKVEHLEAEILRWQATGVRKLVLDDGEAARVRLLPVTLATGYPWLRYGQHWIAREPLTCPESTEVVDKAACPLCEVFKDDPWHEKGLRLSFLLYCLVLERNGLPSAPEALLRLHQLWMPAKAFEAVRTLALKNCQVFSWDADGHDLRLGKQDRKLLVALGPASDWRVPQAERQRLLAAAVSPKRRVRSSDLSYEAMMLGASKSGSWSTECEREY